MSAQFESFDRNSDPDAKEVENTPNDLPFEDGEYAAASCVYLGKVYKPGDEICYMNNKWRCSKAGKWYAINKIC